MNSYPIELLVQQVPLMFVAGLDAPNPQQDPFNQLVTRLREALTTRPKGLVWDRNRASAFNILLVEKNIKFPPRKVIATNEQGAQMNPHSPLSPLIPSSPLYPDGLIAPVWVRKHLELVPSIFVLFLRLWEAPPPMSPLDSREKETEQERFYDQELATELSARKRSLAERGIKLTAVLLASRRMLDDSSLDARLTFIRRQSALDSRAALFVLSPVDDNELQEFVRSLTDALREPSLEYYTNHSKRVRRKRNKHANSAYSGYPASLVATTRAVPLRPIGWTARYEYKMGIFAEFRLEEEVSRKHYEDCWNALSTMFESNTVLPPRTKRWAEAKVLADCVAIKVYKFYLYNNEHALALSYFNRHVKRFCELSKDWGIGDDTFEYWSWLARQYRILAEMLEIALRGGLRLPSLLPQPREDMSVPQNPLEPLPTPGMVPSYTLQHPGYYYFQAARCTQERFGRFRAIESAEIIRPTNVSQSAAFNNEKKVDHWTVILELYSKAYELFKRYAAGQTRLTFFIAVQIATTYHESGKHDLAVKFFERIVKAYHKEEWKAMLNTLLSMWYISAKEVRNVEVCVRLLIERMALETATPSENAILAEELLATLRPTDQPDQPLSYTIDLSPVEQILPSSVVFYQAEADVGASTPIQIHLTPPKASCLHLLPLKRIQVHFSDNRPPLTINHLDGDDRPIYLGHIGDDQVILDGSLTFQPGVTKVLHGAITSNIPEELKLTRIELNVEADTWKIAIVFDPAATQALYPMWLYAPDTSSKLTPLQRTDAAIVTFKPSPHDIDVQINHIGGALIGEEYPIVISVKNTDRRSLEVVVDVLLQPAENDSINYISLGEDKSTGLLRGISYGELSPGAETTRTIFLTTSGAAGLRMIDVSIQSRAPPFKGSDYIDENEILRTVSIEAHEPFRSSPQLSYSQPRQVPSFLEVMALNSSNLESASQVISEVNLTLDVECLAICELDILDVKLSRAVYTEQTPVKLLYDSLATDNLQNSTGWCTGDNFVIGAGFSIHLDPSIEEFMLGDTFTAPVKLEILWRRSPQSATKIVSDKDSEAYVTSTITLPRMQPPEFGVSIVIEPPTIARLHVPFVLDVVVRNQDTFRSAELDFTLEATDGYVVSGFRAGVLPLVLPNTEQKLSFTLIPVTLGLVKLPTFKIGSRAPINKEEGVNPVNQSIPIRPGQRPEDDPVDGSMGLGTGAGRPSPAAGRTIPTVDQRWDAVNEDGLNVRFYVKEAGAGTYIEPDSWLSVLVIP